MGCEGNAKLQFLTFAERTEQKDPAEDHRAVKRATFAPLVHFAPPRAIFNSAPDESLVDRVASETILSKVTIGANYVCEASPPRRC